jgi:hypothetical protein
MRKYYLFNAQTYYSLNSLGEAYANNFEAAIEDVRDNTSKLLKFIKKKNKKLIPKVLDILCDTMYANNVVTFLIYLFLDDKKVYLNGATYTFKQFIDAYKRHHEKGNIFNAFVEDLGIIRTYAYEINTPRFIDDMYNAAKNIDDPFAQSYIYEYFDYDGVESIESFFSNVIFQSEERFKRANEVFHNDRLQKIIAHKVGLGKVLDLRMQRYPVFAGLNLISDELKTEDMLRMITNNYYYWLLDNFEKYNFSGQAKVLETNFRKAKKKYNKILKKENNFNELLEFSEVLFTYYLLFVQYTNAELISVKSKEDKEQFTVNVRYMNTYICYDYMRDHIVSLDLGEIPLNPVEYYFGKKGAKKVYSRKQLINQERVLNRLTSFRRTFELVSVLSFYYIAAVVIYNFIPAASKVFVTPLAGNIVDYVFLAMILFNFIVSAIIKKGITKSQKALDDVLRLDKLNHKEDIPDVNEEDRIEYLAKLEYENKKRAMNSQRFATAFAMASLSFIYSVIIVSMINSIFKFTFDVTILDWANAYNPNTNGIELLFIGPVASLLFGLIFRKKSPITILLPIIFAIVGVFLGTLI